MMKGMMKGKPGCKWCDSGECWSHGAGGGNMKGVFMDFLKQAKGGKGHSKSKFQVDKSGGELGEFVGTIKSFGAQKNYGFIECPDLLATYGDVFLHGDMIKGYKQGHIVKFTAVINKDGKANAIDLKSGLK
mmetsp:Transcript_5076/g.7843  ORF Transcript_5076/g.7843 Transcript_5076/m.7843 type:complete len:131 (-) Transcript_5076:107-499(-)